MRAALLLVAVAQVCLPALADQPYVIGVGLGVDDADGYSTSVLLNYALSDRTTLLADAALTRGRTDVSTLNSSDWRLGIERDLGVVGFSADLGQWGDRGEFEADRWSVGLFRETEHVRVATGFERRDLTLTFRAPNNPDNARDTGVRSDALSIDASFTRDSGVAGWLSATRFRYDRDISRLGQLSLVRLLSPSSLTLSGTLLEHSISVGGDWPAGERVWSLSVARDRTAVAPRDVDSVSLGWLTPIGARTDLDMGVGLSRDGNDSQWVFTLLFLRYGGFD